MLSSTSHFVQSQMQSVYLGPTPVFEMSEATSDTSSQASSDGGSDITDIDADWAVLDPQSPGFLPTYECAPTSDVQRHERPLPPGWLHTIEPMLSPQLAASALGLHHRMRAQANWAVPLARRASDVSAQVGAEVLRHAAHAALVGPPEAKRLAVSAWTLSHQINASVHDQVRWMWASRSERRLAEAWHAWLVQLDYIIDGVLDTIPEFEMMAREGVRRCPTLAHVTIMQWRAWCKVLAKHKGPLMPWDLAAIIKQA